MPKAAKARTKRTKIAAAYRRGEKGKLDRHWRGFFLDHLAETSNVTAAAHFAGVNPARAYKVRREDAAFARKWYAALLEGYEHLELETLQRLREGVPADGPKFDIANALRLLTLHRETVARERSSSLLRLLITPVWLSAPAGTSQPTGIGSATNSAQASTMTPPRSRGGGSSSGRG